MEKLIEEFNATVHNGRLTNAQIDFLRTTCDCDGGDTSSSDEDKGGSSSDDGCQFRVTDARIKHKAKFLIDLFSVECDGFSFFFWIRHSHYNEFESNYNEYIISIQHKLIELLGEHDLSYDVYDEDEQSELKSILEQNLQDIKEEEAEGDEGDKEELREHGYLVELERRNLNIRRKKHIEVLSEYNIASDKTEARKLPDYGWMKWNRFGDYGDVWTLK